MQGWNSTIQVHDVHHSLVLGQCRKMTDGNVDVKKFTFWMHRLDQQRGNDRQLTNYTNYAVCVVIVDSFKNNLFHMCATTGSRLFSQLTVQLESGYNCGCNLQLVPSHCTLSNQRTFGITYSTSCQRWRCIKNYKNKKARSSSGQWRGTWIHTFVLGSLPIIPFVVVPYLPSVDLRQTETSFSKAAFALLICITVWLCIHTWPETNQTK